MQAFTQEGGFSLRWHFKQRPRKRHCTGPTSSSLSHICGLSVGTADACAEHYPAVTFLLGAAPLGRFHSSALSNLRRVARASGCSGECMAFGAGWNLESQSWLTTYVIAGSLLPFPFTSTSIKEGLIILIFHACFKNSR